MWKEDPVYSTDLTDEERELGFEIVELEASQRRSQSSEAVMAVVCRFSDTDQIAKMNVPVIGGFSYRHERRMSGSASRFDWAPVSSIVFPTPEQALNSVGNASVQMQLCR